MAANVITAPDWKDHVERAVAAFFGDTLGPMIRDDARAVVRVQSGRLRSSLGAEVIGTTLYVGSIETPGVASPPPHYSVFVELGTVNMESKPYLQPSLLTYRRPA